MLLQVGPFPWWESEEVIEDLFSKSGQVDSGRSSSRGKQRQRSVRVDLVNGHDQTSGSLDGRPGREDGVQLLLAVGRRRPIVV